MRERERERERERDVIRRVTETEREKAIRTIRRKMSEKVNGGKAEIQAMVATDRHPS